MNKIDLPTSKFAMLSDIHWGISNNSDVKNDILIEYIDWYIKLLKKHKIKTVVFLGDWFDSRTTLSVKTINIVLQICKKFEENKIKMFLIVGNHDIYYKDKLEVNSLNIFNEFKNITVIKEATELYCKKTDKSIYLFPWNTFSNEYGKCDLMLGHFNFQGAKMVGTVNKSGETIETLLKVAPQIFSGHFHLRNTYTRNDGEQLITVGNPVEHTWGDYQNSKGVYIYDLNEMNHEFVENTISPTHQRIYFSKFKQKLEDLKNVKGNFVEFVVDEKATLEVIMKITKAINKRMPIVNCKVDYVFNKTKLSLQEMKFDENSDILNMTKYEYMIQYINENEKEIKEMGMEISTLQTMIKEYYDESKGNDGLTVTGGGNKIVFNNMKVQNFISVGDEIDIDFSDYMGMNYIYGENKDSDRKNGSGKSTIFCDAILWGLFDTTVKKLKKGSIPNRTRGKKCHVKINFSIGKRNFTVVNSVKPTEFTLTEHLDTDDVDLTKSSKAETLKYISEELLNSSYLMFRNCLVLSITNNTNIFEMNKGDKRAFLETMMDYSVIGEMFGMCKKDRNKVDSELTLKRQDALRIETVLEDFKEKQKSFDKNKKTKLAEIQEEIEVLKGRLVGLDTDTKNYGEKREKLKETKQKVLDVIDSLKEKKNDTSNEISGIKGQIDNYNTIHKKYSKVLDCLCDDCKKTADDVLGLDDDSVIKEKEEKIEELKKRVITITDKISQVKEEKLKKVTDNIDILEEKIYKVERNIEKKHGIESSITIKEKQYSDEDERKSDFESLIKKNKKELNTIKDNINELTERKTYLDYIVFLTSEDGIRKNLLTEYISLLNARIRSYLDEMGCEYTLILDDEFNYTFLTTSGECEYDSFSAGEKVTLISACMFAFRDLLFGQGTLQSNLFICDEILDTSLDDISLNNIIKILKKLSEEQNVFLISHRECVTPDDFNNVIKIEKENGFTTIVED
jgi:DNA repair exonuclease SbcCD nuclease subunit